MKTWLIALLLCLPAFSNAADIVGIGARLIQEDNGQIMVADTLADSPARENGILTGDFILAVQTLPEREWIEVTGVDLGQVVGLIRGDEGTVVGLQIQRGDDVFDLRLIRRPLK